MADDIAARVDRLELPFDARGVDNYGVSKWHLTQAFRVVSLLYRNYFQVRANGIENVPARGRVMLVGNHSGGVALDGLMVIASCFFDMEPPRLAHAMADRFINRFPFASVWASRCGQFTGLPKRDRAAIQQSQGEKYPQEYGPLVEQYLKNLSDQSGK